MRFFKNKNAGAMFLILEGIVFTIIVNLYNPFIQIFAKRIGAGSIHIALLNAVPSLVALFVLIPCGILIEKINRKKQTVMVLLFIVSLFYAAIAFVPILPHQAKVTAYVILLGLMNWPGSLYITTWQSFFADNFKGSYANRIYALRSKYGTLFGLITVLVTGFLLTAIPKSDGERLFMYQVFYGICFALTLIQLFLFSRAYVQQHPQKDQQEQKDQRERQEQQSEPVAPEDDATVAEPSRTSRTSRTSRISQISRIFKREDFAGMFSNKLFLTFCLCGFVYHLAWQMGWPLFFIYNANYAGLNEFQFGLINVAAGLTQFLSYSIWNKLIEKKESKLIIIFGAAGMAITPFFFTALRSFPVILIVNVFSGSFVAGFTLTLFGGLLETLPSAKNTLYISVFNTLTSVTGFIAPLVGVWIYNHTNIFMAMFIVGFVRVFATLFYVVRWWRGRRSGNESKVADI